MTLQPRTRNSEPTVRVTDEAWQAFFLVSGAEEAPTERGMNDLDTWTPEQLVTEAIERTAEDGPSLRRIQRRILEALLIALDGEAAPGEMRSKAPEASPNRLGPR